MSKLDELIHEASGYDFEWGVNDCCLFAANIVKKLTGKDYAESFRGKYSSKTEALALISEYGCLYNLLCSLLGEPLTGKPETGDVALFEGSYGDTVGIIYNHWVAGPLDKGVGFLPHSVVQYFWRVQ